MENKRYYSHFIFLFKDMSSLFILNITILSKFLLPNNKLKIILIYKMEANFLLYILDKMYYTEAERGKI